MGLSKKQKLITVLLLLVLAGIGAGAFFYVQYQKIFADNVSKSVDYDLYIPTGSTFEDVLALLEKENVLIDLKSFERTAHYKDFLNVRPGKYRITPKMSNNELVNKLRSGNQTPVNVTFNNIRTREQFAGKISSQLELDSLDLMLLLSNSEFLSTYGLNKETGLSIFIPNTYQFWWNVSAEDFVERMYKEYQKFWNQERLQKAKAIHLSPTEVITLASIVEEENHRTDEQPRIAGVYINRLKKNMLLQADPTVKFALGDFAIKRLLLKDLEINSPYNTYKHTGLPPGQIRIPEASTVDAVLNYEKHNYIFMCAREDFSGYHNFAVTLDQHSANARKYHNALNQQKIRR